MCVHCDPSSTNRVCAWDEERTCWYPLYQILECPTCDKKLYAYETYFKARVNFFEDTSTNSHSENPEVVHGYNCQEIKCQKTEPVDV